MKKRMQVLVEELEEESVLVRDTLPQYTESHIAQLAISQHHIKQPSSAGSNSSTHGGVFSHTMPGSLWSAGSASTLQSQASSGDFSHHPVAHHGTPLQSSFSPMNTSMVGASGPTMLRNGAVPRDMPSSASSVQHTYAPTLQGDSQFLKRMASPNFSSGVSRSSPVLNPRMPMLPSPPSAGANTRPAQSSSNREDTTNRRSSTDSQSTSKTSPDGSIKSLMKENLKLKKLLLEKETKIEYMIKKQQGLKKRKRENTTTEDVSPNPAPPQQQSTRNESNTDTEATEHEDDASCLRSVGFVGNIYKLDGPWTDIPQNVRKNRIVVLCDFELNIVACSFPFIEVMQFTSQELQAGFSLFQLFFLFTNKQLMIRNHRQFLKEDSVHRIQYTDTWFRKDKTMVLFEILLQKHHGLLWLTCLPAANRKSTVSIDEGKEVIHKVFTAATEDQDEDRLNSLYVDHTCVLFHLHEYFEKMQNSSSITNIGAQEANTSEALPTAAAPEPNSTEGNVPQQKGD
eukprot:CAMPEP_0117442476 /NCGR_PEP_ID=MMETSP0759-20121206/4171_1 /TAXON_ID=63605 /ORGANISM="Percolomonas cosmopolitus, Strain WS" /LENGTH=511 /DNA_ID=CAMNT_0005234365 /DNA_START=580 /DNA_END=2115 /DNA_ORIENTATION=-